MPPTSLRPRQSRRLPVDLVSRFPAHARHVSVARLKGGWPGVASQERRRLTTGDDRLGPSLRPLLVVRLVPLALRLVGGSGLPRAVLPAVPARWSALRPARSRHLLDVRGASVRVLHRSASWRDVPHRMG